MNVRPANTPTLEHLASDQGVFKLLAADHRGSLRRLLRPDDPDGVTLEEITQVKRDIVSELSPYVTGVMLEAGVAAQCVSFGELAGGVELIVTSETDGYEAVARGEPAALIDGWDLDRVHELGSVTVKILVQQPLGRPALRSLDRDFVLRVHSACRELGLCLVLEVLVPDGDRNHESEWVGALVRAASELSPYCDLYKTSFPDLSDDAQAGRMSCGRISEASNAPWVVLSGGVSPNRFAQQLEIACQEGASGYLAGRAVWADALSVNSVEQRQRLRELAVPRLEMYGAIVDRFARPWYESRAFRPVDRKMVPRKTKGLE